MSYDLHIVCTEHWTEAASAPVTKQDVDALIAADSELAWSKTDYVDMVDAAGISRRYWMITWRGQPCFWWYGDQIQCPGPDGAQVAKLVQMSRVLRARVVGDDGEVYPLEQLSVLGAGPTTVPARKPWPLWKQLITAFLIGCVLLALKLLVSGP